MSTGNLTLLWKSLGVLIFSMTKPDAKKKKYYYRECILQPPPSAGFAEIIFYCSLFPSEQQLA